MSDNQFDRKIHCWHLLRRNQRLPACFHCTRRNDFGLTSFVPVTSCPDLSTPHRPKCPPADSEVPLKVLGLSRVSAALTPRLLPRGVSGSHVPSLPLPQDISQGEHGHMVSRRRKCHGHDSPTQDSFGSWSICHLDLPSVSTSHRVTLTLFALFLLAKKWQEFSYLTRCNRNWLMVGR